MSKITLRLVDHGEATIEVDEDEYRQAKDDGELDLFLDAWASDIPTSYVVVEPDGTLIEPASLRDEPRFSLLGEDVTAAIAAIIEQARPHQDCAYCAARTCSRHVAERLVDAVRHEALIIMPIEQAEAVIRQAATDGRLP